MPTCYLVAWPKLVEVSRLAPDVPEQWVGRLGRDCVQFQHDAWIDGHDVFVAAAQVAEAIIDDAAEPVATALRESLFRLWDGPTIMDILEGTELEAVTFALSPATTFAMSDRVKTAAPSLIRQIIAKQGLPDPGWHFETPDDFARYYQMWGELFARAASARQGVLCFNG